jgi:hypothetical protein
MAYYISRGIYFFLLIVLSIVLALFLPNAPSADKFLLIINPSSQGSLAFIVGVNYGAFLVASFILGDYLFQTTRTEPILNDDTIVNVGTSIIPFGFFILTILVSKGFGFAVDSFGGAILGWSGIFTLGITLIFLIGFPILQLIDLIGSKKRV